MEFDADRLNSNSSSDHRDESDFPNTTPIAKGKRTKRPRHQQTPLLQLDRAALTTALSAESASTSTSTSTTATAIEEASAFSTGSIITEEEEDMANCLILLAQGAFQKTPKTEAEKSQPKPDPTPVPRLVGPAPETAEKPGIFLYDCKTCNKCFPSFQALGGHRASHKKPKLTAQTTTEETKAISIDEDMLQIGMNSFSNAKTKVHECSICGAEFSSGQALGGHMRRHRPLVAPTVADRQVKERNILSLDLNLPAPVGDDELFGLVTPWIAITN